ncbi:hypothetical protein LguiA_021234 [Lonicera macranthoides]
MVHENYPSIQQVSSLRTKPRKTGGEQDITRVKLGPFEGPESMPKSLALFGYNKPISMICFGFILSSWALELVSKGPNEFLRAWQ